MQAPKFEKFIKLMKMTTSPVDGECLNAIRMANSFLMEANLEWDDFLRGKAKSIGGSAASHYSNYGGKKYDNADEIERMLEATLASVRKGTSFRVFIESLRDWWESNQFLTEKQYNALRKTYERI